MSRGAEPSWASQLFIYFFINHSELFTRETEKSACGVGLPWGARQLYINTLAPYKGQLGTHRAFTSPVLLLNQSDRLTIRQSLNMGVLPCWTLYTDLFLVSPVP